MSDDSQQDQEDERRNRGRIEARRPLVLRSDGAEHRGLVEDLSSSGLRLRLRGDADLKVGGEVECDFSVPGIESRVTVTAVIQWIKAPQLGVALEKPLPMQVLSAARRQSA